MKKEPIECYPWAAPTEEQKRMFDNLNYNDQLEMLRSVIKKGEESGVSDKTLLEIMAEVKARIKEQNKF